MLSKSKSTYIDNTLENISNGVKKIVVIGAGPAGMMAAIRAAELHQEAVLIERNPCLGRKLLLSGKGRCNLTNACTLEEFLRHFSGGGAFLRDAFKKFFNLDLMRFFENRGLALKTERQLRVFPVTDRSASIVDILKKELHKNRVSIIYKARVKDILVKDGSVRAVIFWDGREVLADRVILATGGASFRFTGSSGDGLVIAKKLGHKITGIFPALVALQIKDSFPRLLCGLTLKNIRVTFSDGKRKLVSPIGELLFTDFGISGPLVLALSGRVAQWLKGKKNVYVAIDLKPALSYKELEARLLREFKQAPKMTARNIIRNLMPKNMADVFLQLAKVPPGKQAAQITYDERQRIIRLLKGLRLDVKDTLGLDKAMITAGGVSLKDIDPRTMQSRKVRGLYFAGEIIDLDADTGGFNLQAAFSTGYLAGESTALN